MSRGAICRAFVESSSSCGGGSGGCSLDTGQGDRKYAASAASASVAAARQWQRQRHGRSSRFGCTIVRLMGSDAFVYQGTHKLRATILRWGGRWRRQQCTRDRRRRMFRPLLLLRSRDEERTTRRLSDPRSRICGFYDVSLNNNHLNYV